MYRFQKWGIIGSIFLCLSYFLKIFTGSSSRKFLQMHKTTTKKKMKMALSYSNSHYWFYALLILLFSVHLSMHIF